MTTPYRHTIFWIVFSVLAFAAGIPIKFSTANQSVVILPIALVWFALYKVLSSSCPSCQKPLMFEDRGEKLAKAKRHWPEKTCSRCGADLTLATVN